MRSRDDWSDAVPRIASNPTKRQSLVRALTAAGDRIRWRPIPSTYCPVCGTQFTTTLPSECPACERPLVEFSDIYDDVIKSMVQGMIAEAAGGFQIDGDVDIADAVSDHVSETITLLTGLQNGPEVDQLHDWLMAGHCPASALDEWHQRMTSTDAWHWYICDDASQTTAVEDVSNILRFWLPSLVHQFRFSELMCEAKDIPVEQRPGFPLQPILLAWDETPRASSIEERVMGILPATLVKRVPAIEPPNGIAPPSVPGFSTMAAGPSCLPSLVPGDKPLPALLHVYDRTSARSARGNNPPAAIRLFVQLLLSLPVLARDGRLHEIRLPVRDLIKMIGWEERNYRPTGSTTGRVLETILESLNGMRVEMHQNGAVGWYFPILVSAVQGLFLDSHVSLVMRLPTGSGVGPPIDRNMLRYLGIKSAPAYRGYLALCCDWNEVATHRGRQIRPTQPEVRRANGGQIVDARGNVIVGNQGRPMTSPYNPRAVKTGNRISNPARTRYKSYDGDDLARICFPEHTLTDQSNIRKYRKRALDAVALIEQFGGCFIDRLGENTKKGLPWRIMAPDIVE